VDHPGEREIAAMAATARRLIALALAALVAASAGCGDHGRARPVSAELADETPDRLAREGETILVALDRPLPEEWSPEGVKIRASPDAGEWTAEARRGADGRTVEVVIVRGSPDFRLEGIHGRDEGATGLGVDLGDGNEVWVDLQVRRSLPVLEGAVWEDVSPPGGNLVVDRGDRIRLIFDRPVELRPGQDAKRVRTPQDIILSKASDRLDDGVTRAVFEKGEGEREVRIVLGSRPTLTVAGNLGAGGAIERFRQTAPSGLAVNGTAVLPMPAITARGGGPGAVSEREVDLRHADGFPQPRGREGESFPAPGNRFSHTVTPTMGGRAIVAGGESAEGRQAIDQILAYNPFHAPGEEAFRVAGRLPHPSHSHTATVLAGPDETYGTGDDAILIAGGNDGSRSLGELTVLRPLAGDVVVEPLETGLRVPRSDHAAAAIGGNRVIVDGGRSRGVGLTPGLVGCAEILKIGFEAGKARVAEHFVFRTLARSGHTLTLLPGAAPGGGHVLAYGGFGRDRRRFIDPLPFGQRIEGAPGEDVFWPQDERTVLISPVVLDLRNPEASITEVPYEFSLPLLRWGHQAFLLDGGGAAEDMQVVLIAGGSLRHPVLHFDGGPDLWELPLRPRDAVLAILPELPQGHEASSAILFRHDPRDPSRSRLEVVPHPSPDPGQTSERLSFAAVPVPGLGVILLGGEEPGGPREVRCLDGAEVFLAGEEELAEMAFRLAAGRARHQAYLVETESTRSIFLIGGIPGSADRTGFSPVEEVPLRRAAPQAGEFESRARRRAMR
jgi:hypothetical protein